ncbi:hypothetical protein EVAR_57245_1 [Eumeta japonica]|uniref:Uncharacterized protein n=1 Tax=Eumeta variegata TaxID=151549 RepID=A0A4C1YT09_EUMVA|nr:hypothetical protein EVAR_57245_1 [Eumeta japonica]
MTTKKNETGCLFFVQLDSVNEEDLARLYSTTELLNMPGTTVEAWWERRRPPSATTVSYSGTPRITKGIIHYAFLPLGKSISLDLYCHQLMRLKLEVEQKRPELIKRKDALSYCKTSSRRPVFSRLLGTVPQTSGKLLV